MKKRFFLGAALYRLAKPVLLGFVERVVEDYSFVSELVSAFTREIDSES